jgi:hypothetical protein
MDNTLTPEMQQQIRAYCDQVCAMNGLDHVREELQDHFEDKMLAYLSCSEKLQEQDAFLLVREHFGDAAVLKSMFQTVHVREAGVTLGRKLAAVAAATLALTLAMRVVYVLVDPFLVMAQFNADTMWIGVAGFTLVHCATMVLVPVLLFLTLRHWGRAHEEGAEPWYVRRSGSVLLLAIVGLFLAGRLVPYASWSMSGEAFRGPTTEALTVQRWILGAVGVPAVALQILIWLWWCDRAPRSRSALGIALSVWLGLHLLCGVVSSLALPSLGLLISDHQTTLGSGLPVLANPSLFGADFNISLASGSPLLWQMLVSGASRGNWQLLAVVGSVMKSSVSYTIASILLALPVYIFVRRAAARRSAEA